MAVARNCSSSHLMKITAKNPDASGFSRRLGSRRDRCRAAFSKPLKSMSGGRFFPSLRPQGEQPRCRRLPAQCFLDPPRWADRLGSSSKRWTPVRSLGMEIGTSEVERIC